MNHNEKKEILKCLSEKEFRQDLIIPLLGRMGYTAPIEYHGNNEKGKDIICFEFDKLDEQRLLSIVAKIGDLTGSASTNAGLMNVINQVQQAFDNPIDDFYNMRNVFVNEVWVMTTGKIVSGAQESVIQTLRKSNLDKHIRIIGDDRLVQLIDKHFSTYWNHSSETKESVIIQRDRLLNFIEELLSASNIDRATIESVKSSILYSSYNPSIVKNTDGLHISQVSAFSIELAKMDADFDDYIVSNVFGITKDIFRDAKKHLSYSFYDIEETMKYADEAMKLTNPWEFAIEALSNLTRDYPFERPSGDASKFIDTIHSLEEGLRELKWFKNYLKHIGKLEWVKELAVSITHLLPEIEKIIDNSKGDEVIINYTVCEKEKVIKIQYDNQKNSVCFGIKFKRIESNGNDRNKDGSLKPSYVMRTSLFKFREYIEKIFEYDEAKWLSDYVEDWY